MSTTTDRVMMKAAMEQRSLNEREKMSLLCDSFPSLRDAPGACPWDQHAFAKWASTGISDGERLAAAFVLSVWNGGDGGWWTERPFRVGTFDAVRAFAVWDYQHQEAFSAWCKHPFWP